MSCLPVRSQGDRHCWLSGPQRRLFRPAAHAYRRRHKGSTWGGGQHLDGGAGAGVDVGRLLGILHLHHDIFVFYLLAPRALVLGLIKDFQVSNSKFCLNEPLGTAMPQHRDAVPAWFRITALESPCEPRRITAVVPAYNAARKMPAATAHAVVADRRCSRLDCSKSHSKVPSTGKVCLYRTV